MCEIYTDVRGVFSADPRLVPDARLLGVVSFEEMLEMAASGAKVLQLRSVEYARNHEIRIHCRSSFEDGPGTLVVSEKQTMERPSVTAVTHADEARVTLTGVRDEPGVAAQIFGALAGANVNVDMIIQNEPVSADQKADLSFTVDPGDLQAATEALDRLEICERLGTDERIGKVSIVGAGMRSHPGVAAQGLPDPGRGRDQHRDDLHLADQDLVRDRGRRGPGGGQGAAPGVRAGRGRRPARGADRRRAPAGGQAGRGRGETGDDA